METFTKFTKITSVLGFSHDVISFVSKLLKQQQQQQQQQQQPQTANEILPGPYQETQGPMMLLICRLRGHDWHRVPCLCVTDGPAEHHWFGLRVSSDCQRRPCQSIMIGGPSGRLGHQASSARSTQPPAGRTVLFLSRRMTDSWQRESPPFQC